MTLPSALAHLSALASAATPGPWRLLDGHIVQTRHITRDVWTIPHADGDLPFIAALDPTTVRAMIAVCGAAQLLAKEANAVANGEGHEPLGNLAIDCESAISALEAALKGKT